MITYRAITNNSMQCAKFVNSTEHYLFLPQRARERLFYLLASLKDMNSDAKKYKSIAVASRSNFDVDATH